MLRCTGLSFSLFTLKAFEEAAKRLKIDEEDRKKMVRAMTFYRIF